MADFESISTGNKGDNLITPSGFEFENVNNNDLVIEDITNVGHSLFFECKTTVMVLPNLREYVTIRHLTDDWAVNFVAYDSNGNIIDHASAPAGETRGLSTLHEPGSKIDYVYMHHVNSVSECEKNCGEP